MQTTTNAILLHNPVTGTFLVKEPVKCPVCKAMHYLLVNRWGRTTCIMCSGTEFTGGAVDLSECRDTRCGCEKCAVCGFRKHTAIHGPLFGCPPGTRPYGHKFEPVRDA